MSVEDYPRPLFADAFTSVPGEVDIPIAATHPFRFTRRWFNSRNRRTWSTFLPRKFDGTTPVRMIQIGVWEGMDLIWCLQNILKHPDSRVVAMDPWLAMLPKHTQEKMDMRRDNAYHNLSPWKDKVDIRYGLSQEILLTLDFGELDLVVIDGDHSAEAAYLDAVYSLPKMKPGGWMVFDDVRRYKRGQVIDGLAKFWDEHQDQVKIVWQHRHCDCLEVL